MPEEPPLSDPPTDPLAGFPDELRQRLQAAGVSDAASLEAALATDPQLTALIQAMLAAEDGEQLDAFW